MIYTLEISLDSKNKDYSKYDKSITFRTIQLTANQLLRNLKIKTPVDKGRARGSWAITKMRFDSAEVKSSASYMKYLDKGTGIYGPKGQPITPTTKKVLKFVYKGKTVFAKQVKGIQPQKIVEKSIQATTPKIPEFVKQAINEVVK